jgi:hypothetical protein
MLHVTALLATDYEGMPLPPLLVYQATPGGRVDKDVRSLDKADRIYHMASAKGFCNSQEVMPLWITKIFNPAVIAVSLFYNF